MRRCADGYIEKNGRCEPGCPPGFKLRPNGRCKPDCKDNQIECGDVCLPKKTHTCQSGVPVPLRKRGLASNQQCGHGLTLCPVPWGTGYECLDTRNDIESCKSPALVTCARNVLIGDPSQLTYRRRMLEQSQQSQQCRRRLHCPAQYQQCLLLSRHLPSPLVSTWLCPEHQRHRLRGCSRSETPPPHSSRRSLGIRHWTDDWV